MTKTSPFLYVGIMFLSIADIFLAISNTHLRASLVQANKAIEETQTYIDDAHMEVLRTKRLMDQYLSEHHAQCYCKSI